MTKNIVTIKIENVTFHLQEEHEFDWLQKLGRVLNRIPETLALGLKQTARRIYGRRLQFDRRAKQN